MAIEFHTDDATRTIELIAKGTLTKDDYKTFTPVAEAFIRKHGKANILFEMHDFTGWTPGASWEDLKFDMHHFADFERLAMVGEKTWEHAMEVLMKPFTRAKVQYFDITQADQARSWLADG